LGGAGVHERCLLPTGQKETAPMDTIRLPHHRLQAYGVAIELLRGVREARIRDAHLRDQAMRAAKSACLNAAEGAGRVSRADKARVFGIARAEAGEAAAAVEIAVAAGDAEAGSLEGVLVSANRFIAMMTGLIR
jgi:four helix bundle protein